MRTGAGREDLARPLLERPLQQPRFKCPSLIVACVGGGGTQSRAYQQRRGGMPNWRGSHLQLCSALSHWDRCDCDRSRCCTPSLVDTHAHGQTSVSLTSADDASSCAPHLVSEVESPCLASPCVKARHVGRPVCFRDDRSLTTPPGARPLTSLTSGWSCK